MPVASPPTPVYAGDTLTIEYRFRDDTDTPVDLTAWTFTAQWRAAPSEATSVPFTVDQTNRSTGVIVLTMSATQTAAMGRSGVFDLQGVNGSVVRTFVSGSTVYTPDVTRA